MFRSIQFPSTNSYAFRRDGLAGHDTCLYQFILRGKKRWVISLFNYSFLARQYRNLSWYKWNCGYFGIVTLGCNRSILQVQVGEWYKERKMMAQGLFLCVDSPQRSVTSPITVTGWPSVHGDSLRHGSIHGLLWSFKPWKNQHEKEDLRSKWWMFKG